MPRILRMVLPAALSLSFVLAPASRAGDPPPPSGGGSGDGAAGTGLGAAPEAGGNSGGRGTEETEESRRRESERAEKVLDKFRKDLGDGFSDKLKEALDKDADLLRSARSSRMDGTDGIQLGTKDGRQIRIEPSAEGPGSQPSVSIQDPPGSEFRPAAREDVENLPFLKDIAPPPEGGPSGDRLSQERLGEVRDAVRMLGSVFGGGLQEALAAAPGGAVSMIGLAGRGAAGPGRGASEAEVLRGAGAGSRVPRPRGSAAPAAESPSEETSPSPAPYSLREVSGGRHPHLFLMGQDGKPREVGYPFDAGGRTLYYGDKTGDVYDAKKGYLGSYDDVMARLDGSRSPGRLDDAKLPHAYVNPDGSRGTLDGKDSFKSLRSGARILSPSGKEVGYVPDDKERYGDEKVVFYHGNNAEGGSAEGKSDWAVYSAKDGRKLGDFGTVKAYDVQDHSGRAERKVLSPTDRKGVYQDLKGTPYKLEREVSLGADGRYRSSEKLTPYYNAKQSETFDDALKYKASRSATGQDAREALLKSSKELGDQEVKKTLKDEAAKRNEGKPGGDLRTRLERRLIDGMTAEQARNVLERQVQGLSDEAAQGKLKEKAEERLAQRVSRRYPGAEKSLELKSHLPELRKLLAGEGGRPDQKGLSKLREQYAREEEAAKEAAQGAKDREVETPSGPRKASEYLQDLKEERQRVREALEGLRSDRRPLTDERIGREHQLSDYEYALGKRIDGIGDGIRHAEDRAADAQEARKAVDGLLAGLADPRVGAMMSKWSGLAAELGRRQEGLSGDARDEAREAFFRETGLSAAERTGVDAIARTAYGRRTAERSDKDSRRSEALDELARSLPPDSPERKAAQTESTRLAEKADRELLGGRYETRSMEYLLSRGLQDAGGSDPGAAKALEAMRGAQWALDAAREAESRIAMARGAIDAATDPARSLRWRLLNIQGMSER